MKCKERRITVVETGSRKVLSKRSNRVTELARPSAENRGRVVERIRLHVLVAVRVPNHNLSGAAAGGYRNVAEIERPRRHLAALHQNSVDVDIDRRGSRRGAGKSVRRVANEIRIEIEVSRDCDAAQRRGAAERVGRRDRVAERPASEPSCVIDDVVAQAANEVAMRGAKKAVVNEIS